MTGVIGYTFGSFDLMHAGHSVFFRDCRKHCDLLFVGLHTDPSTDRSSKNKPVQTVYERYVQLINCQWVDHVIPYETEADLINLIQTANQIDVRFLGSDYLLSSFTGKDLCVAKNIDIKYIDRHHSFSSSELRKRVGNHYVESWTEW